MSLVKLFAGQPGTNNTAQWPDHMNHTPGHLSVDPVTKTIINRLFAGKHTGNTNRPISESVRLQCMMSALAPKGPV